MTTIDVPDESTALLRDEEREIISRVLVILLKSKNSLPVCLKQ